MSEFIVSGGGRKTQDVNIVGGSASGTQYADGTARGTATGTLAMGDDGTNIQSIKVDSSGELQIDVLSSALPSGASTSALQSTGNTSLATVAGAVSGTEMQVDIVASIPAGTNNIGDVDVASIAAGTNYIGKTRLTDGTTDAEVVPLTGYNAQAVAIVDGSGNQITSFGGGTQYTEDVAAAADPTGTVPILIRKDTPAAITNTDGDNIAQRATNYGAAYVQVVNSSGSFVDTFGGGTQYAEDGALGSTPTGTLAMYRRDDALSTLTPVEDDAVSGRVNARGAHWVALDTTVTPIVAGDVAHDSADSGNPVKVGGKAKNYGSLPTAVTDADRANFLTDRYGAQFVQVGSPYARPNSSEYSANQTAAAMITAAANEAVRVYGLVITIDYNSTSTITMTIGFGTSSLDTVLYKGYNLVPGSVTVIPIPAVTGASNEDLRITFTGYSAGFVNVITYYDLIAI